MLVAGPPGIRSRCSEGLVCINTPPGPGSEWMTFALIHWGEEKEPWASNRKTGFRWLRSASLSGFRVERGS